MFFRQCTMMRKHPESGATEVHVAWVPEQFARAGKTLSLLQQDGTWSEGWTVETVHDRLSEEYVREHERDYRTQREASDKFTPNRGLLRVVR